MTTLPSVISISAVEKSRFSSVGTHRNRPVEGSIRIPSGTEMGSYRTTSNSLGSSTINWNSKVSPKLTSVMGSGVVTITGG